MKKTLITFLFIITSVIFSETDTTAKTTKDTSEVILQLIKEVDEKPALESNLPKYERIIKFAEESTEVQVFLIDDIYKFPDARISATNKRLLQGSYIAGALRKQLENKQKIITISDGIQNELKVYKILRDTKYVKVEYLEWLLDVERQGGLGQIFYDYDVMGMEIYQNSLGVPEDIEALGNILNLPSFLEVSNEKVLLTNMSLSMLADLSTMLEFYVVSDDYNKSQSVLDNKAKLIIKKLLENEKIKKIYEKSNYSGIIIEFVSPKENLSKDGIYKRIVNEDKDVEMKPDIKQNIYEKEKINAWTE